MAALVQAQVSPVTPATDAVLNGLLSRMPRDVQQRLTAQSVRVPIAKGDVLCGARTARIELTQERLGEALGLQRTGVTAASVALQDGGAIKARHGRITIVDRRRLESLACECYRILASRDR